MTVRPLPPVLAEKAKKELNEDPQRLPSDLQHIKDWIAKQSHLNVRTDDQWLLAFLRGSKFSLERAKEKIDLYYSVQTTAPELFSFTPKNPRFVEILESGAFLILPQTQGPGYPKLSIIRPGKYDAGKVSIAEVISVKTTLQKILFMEDDDAVVSGETTILDLENVTMGHFMQMTPLIIKKIATVVQDAAPLRMKGVHCLNTPPGFETIFNAMKSFLNEKNRNRMDIFDVQEFRLFKKLLMAKLETKCFRQGNNYNVPKTCSCFINFRERCLRIMLKDVENIKFDDCLDEVMAVFTKYQCNLNHHEYWKTKVQDYEGWLEDDVKYGSDESKRLRKSTTAETPFGTVGAFRKLEFD